MARRAAPFHVRSRDGYAHFDATIGGKRFREALEGPDGRGIRYPSHRPSRDETRTAFEAATKRYAEIVGGRTLVPTERVLTPLRLDELCAVWLDAIETPRNGKSIKVKMGYVRHWVRFASDEAVLPDGRLRWADDKRTPLERLVADGSPDDYGIMRLGGALRKTVRKEITALFEMLNWAHRRKYLASVPPRHPLPKGEAGVRTGPQRSKPVHIDPNQARDIISALPEWSDGARAKRKDLREKAFRVRDVFDFMWEMTWRPSTIARLSVPKNWSRGRTTLHIHDEDDKALYGREVTLSPRAMEILDRVAPAEGLIFGDHDYRKYIKAAAKKVLSPEQAKAFARYDFRHGRINHMLETSGNMPGTAYVAGHKQLTTTNAYLRPQTRQGDDVMRAMSEALTPHVQGVTIQARAAEAPHSSAANDRIHSDSQSGRVDSNHRPPDPQNPDRSQPCGISNGADAPCDANCADLDAPNEHIPARFRHASRKPLAKVASGARSVRVEVEGRVVAQAAIVDREPVADVEARLRLAVGQRGGLRGSR